MVYTYSIKLCFYNVREHAPCVPNTELFQRPEFEAPPNPRLFTACQ